SFKVTPCALQPAAGHRVLAAERPAVPRDPDGEARRTRMIALVQIEPIGALTRAEDTLGIVEPPRGKPEALERCRTFTNRQRLHEQVAGVRPCAARERLDATPTLRRR